MLAIAEYNGWSSTTLPRDSRGVQLGLSLLHADSQSGGWNVASSFTPALGCGWQGYCTAPGYDGVIPETQRLQEECSIGYSSTCPRLPADRPWDAIRFAVSRENEFLIQVVYVCEKNHLPAEHGNLEYRVQDTQWAVAHTDPRIQKKAECFLDSWLQKKRPTFPTENQSESIDEQS
jgi:hypothetical protein